MAFDEHVETDNPHILEPNACAFDELSRVHETRKICASLSRSVLADVCTRKCANKKMNEEDSCKRTDGLTRDCNHHSSHHS